jgi:predicted ATPase
MIVEELIDLFESISDERPVLLVIDDLHWAEGATLLTLEWVMRRLTAAPLMLVVGLRPSPRSSDLARLLEDAERLGATLVGLDPLPDPVVDALCQRELGASLGPSLSAAVGRAGGSPLWVLELLRSLVLERRIEYANGVAELRAGVCPARSGSWSRGGWASFPSRPCGHCGRPRCWASPSRWLTWRP